MAYIISSREGRESILILKYTLKIRRVGTSLSRLVVLFKALTTIYSIILLSI